MIDFIKPMACAIPDNYTAFAPFVQKWSKVKKYFDITEKAQILH
jgi:hypothetical protein